MNARDKNDNVVYTISTKTYNNTPQKIKKASYCKRVFDVKCGYQRYFISTRNIMESHKR